MSIINLANLPYPSFSREKEFADLVILYFICRGAQLKKMVFYNPSMFWITRIWCPTFFPHTVRKLILTWLCRRGILTNQESGRKRTSTYRWNLTDRQVLKDWHPKPPTVSNVNVPLCSRGFSYNHFFWIVRKSCYTSISVALIQLLD